MSKPTAGPSGEIRSRNPNELLTGLEALRLDQSRDDVSLDYHKNTHTQKQNKFLKNRTTQ